MKWQASAATDAAVAMPAVAEPETEMESRPATTAGDAKDDWLCAWCHHRVASERDRFSYAGKDEFIFFNPEGLRFEIITFSQTLGCVQSGEPTLAHTWFPGHAWSYCQCARCGRHLGWYYAGPQQFAGLIKDRLARALNLWN